MTQKTIKGVGRIKKEKLVCRSRRLWVNTYVKIVLNVLENDLGQEDDNACLIAGVSGPTAGIQQDVLVVHLALGHDDCDRTLVHCLDEKHE